MKHSLKQDNFPDYNRKPIMAIVTFLWAKSNNVFCKWMQHAKAISMGSSKLTLVSVFSKYLFNSHNGGRQEDQTEKTEGHLCFLVFYAQV